jgi:hypothetical protein
MSRKAALGFAGMHSANSVCGYSGPVMNEEVGIVQKSANLCTVLATVGM